MDQKHTAAAQCVSLSSKAIDEATALSDMLTSFVALQRFVQPQYADEVQDHVPASRGGMHAMLDSLNADVQRRLSALTDTLIVLGAQARLTMTSLPSSQAS